VIPNPLAARLAHIEPFHVMELLQRARALEAAGRSIIHMEIGEPDFPTAAPIVEAGIEALRQGQTFYTPAAGVPALREAIAAHYQRRYGVDVSPGRVFVTPGGSGALLLALALLVEPGQEVLLPDPGYPCNRHFVRVLNGVPRSIPVGPDSRYQLQAGDIAAHWSERTIAAMAATPSNPTGTLLTPEQLQALSAAVRERDGALLVDEIYHGLTYDIEPATAAALPAFVVNSFSKYFGMTGWRLGWLVVPEGYERAAEKVAQNVFISASAPAQHAALACFTPAAEAIFEERRQAFAARRDYLLPALQELGFRIHARPQGAFYLYADCSALAPDSFELSRRLLEEAGVAVTPGLDFGSHAAERHVRFAYTNSLPSLQEGVRRIGAFLGR
jgi:aspartate/methionine/tyrosine aminotransferase